MARKPRIHYPGAYYHVILRGNARQDIFFEDSDRYRFYLLLQEGTERFGHRIHAFCLMTNHVHLVVQVAEKPLSRIIQNLAFRYTRWVNWRKQSTGHLFQGRYKAIVVDGDAYLLELVRYTHLNPVRAGITPTPSAFRWSSHAAYCGTEVIPWLTAEPVLAQFSIKMATARRRYAAFGAEGMGEGHRPDFHGAKSPDTRLLGDDVFIDRVLSETEEPPLSSRLTAEDLVALVSAHYPLVDLGGRRHQDSAARAVCAWLALETGSCTLTELARLLKRDVSTLSAAARRIGERQKVVQGLSNLLCDIEENTKTKA